MTIRVRSKVRCGHRQDGSAFLVEGEQTLDEPLWRGEQELLDALVQAGEVEILSSPTAPPAAPASPEIPQETSPPKTKRSRARAHA